ncbi:Crp/Fnr family transcriptional regulator [candidate division CSSED10-310 bacterium]|uniref:Crp/Fnr family transcriptional regulator n=1 Tax=candidate division CSSED10-310 bacterium TaxID=2855610 RepID=A0ABV6YYT3_UNCC1
MDNKDFLKQVEIFRDLSEDELFEVSRSLSEMKAPTGTVIIEERTPGDSLYIIKKGRVMIEKEAGERKALLAELTPPLFFGEMSLIDDYPHSAKVTAVEDSELLLINRLDLEIILNWNTVLGVKMWRSFSKVLSERLRQTNDRIFQKMYDADDTTSFQMWSEVMK